MTYRRICAQARPMSIEQAEMLGTPNFPHARYTRYTQPSPQYLSHNPKASLISGQQDGCRTVSFLRPRSSHQPCIKQTRRRICELWYVRETRGGKGKTPQSSSGVTLFPESRNGAGRSCSFRCCRTCLEPSLFSPVPAAPSSSTGPLCRVSTHMVLVSIVDGPPGSRHASTWLHRQRAQPVSTASFQRIACLCTWSRDSGAR
ncbi:uncharacterized protein J3D65DRAFT_341043 [Phyllosticta citribraziliensis]|uniref:Uncharacterized protein n=1 Tax=Phyllosticta citribraziliensis TaxID=989973 RepID=A0ABR1LX78_9PEZI